MCDRTQDYLARHWNGRICPECYGVIWKGGSYPNSITCVTCGLGVIVGYDVAVNDRWVAERNTPSFENTPMFDLLAESERIPESCATCRRRGRLHMEDRVFTGDGEEHIQVTTCESIWENRQVIDGKRYPKSLSQMWCCHYRAIDMDPAERVLEVEERCPGVKKPVKDLSVHDVERPEIRHTGHPAVVTLYAPHGFHLEQTSTQRTVNGQVSAGFTARRNAIHERTCGECALWPDNCGVPVEERNRDTPACVFFVDPEGD
jgi:hypothetical protein